MDFRTIIWIISMGITAGTPLLFAAVGEILTERSGVLNLGLEGLMLMGAVTGFSVAHATGNKWLAVLAVLAISALLGLILAVLMVTFKANQIATGIAVSIFLTGLSTLVGKPVLGVLAGDRFRKISIPFLAKIPLLQMILEKDILVYIALIICVLAFFLLYRTKAGLHLRVVGDSPATLDSLGVSVVRTRYLYVIIGSMLTGVGGAYLSLAYTPTWVEGMAAGRGWLTIALVNFALWNPGKAVYGAYLFGIFYALSFRIEAMGIAVPSYFLRMIPYILPIIILILSSLNKKINLAPKALCLPYDREGK